jgi:hypothetical protein
MAIIILEEVIAAQNSQTTKNVILVVMDGLRWQEVFNGADSAMINNKTYVSNKIKYTKKYWDNDLNLRRSKLLPFLWTTKKRKWSNIWKQSKKLLC